jgi:hypothetical protein
MESPTDAVNAAKAKAARLALAAEEASRAATAARMAATVAIIAAADAKDEAEAIAEGRAIGRSSASDAVGRWVHSLGKHPLDDEDEVELIFEPPPPTFDENIVDEGEEVCSDSPLSLIQHSPVSICAMVSPSFFCAIAF